MFTKKRLVSLIAPIGGSSFFFRYGEKLLQKAGIATTENAETLASEKNV